MANPELPPDDGAFVERALQAVIRIGLVLLLVAWCFTIVRPFVVPVIWGIIIAVASYPGFVHLTTALGDRRGLTAVVYALIALLVLIAPMMVLGGTVVDSARAVSSHLGSGTLDVPPPPEGIRDWPLVGGGLFEFWELASTNLEEAVKKIGPQLKTVGSWLLGLAGQSGIALLQFVIAIFISAALLANAGGGEQVADDIAARLIGPRGPDYADLAQKTIRSVAYGIVGVALIQSILAGLGFLVVGLPGAGLLALLCLLLIITQIGPALVMIPVVIYVFYVADTSTAVIFAVWCTVVTLLDNVLKPMLLGRGVDVPMLVIFIGAVGGLLSSGIIGLFVGPVVLALGYTVFKTWLTEARARAPAEPDPGSPPA